MEENEQKNKIYDLLNSIKVTKKNKEIIEKIKNDLEENNILSVIESLKELKEQSLEIEQQVDTNEKENDENIKDDMFKNGTKESVNISNMYSPILAKDDLEKEFIGMLLNEPKSISVYYFKYNECFFANDDLLNVYKMILFTEAEKYAPEAAKQNFNFAKVTEESNRLKEILKEHYKNTKRKIEDVYIKLKKLFVIRKHYLGIPVKSVQKEISDILNYKLYDKMSVEEVESAIEQVTVTEKFKRSILNDDITEFLVKGDNTLTNGLNLPFKILSSVFKGIRQGETMAFAMPSNSGKSRFTINMAAYIALIHKKKVLIISNEMSEEKMKLCLITTILNNPEIQQLHGKKLHKTEGELLEFKFRPNDDAVAVKVDKDGFVLKEEGETQAQFVKRLSKISTEFNMTTAVTDWFHKQVNNLSLIHISEPTRP